MSSALRLGYAVTCIILGGQILASVNTGSLPLIVGVIIVSICSLIPCFIGYDVVHTYERYAWVPLLVIMFFLWGLGGHAGLDIQAQKSAEESGRTLTANVISFGAIVFGNTAGVSVVFEKRYFFGSTASSGRPFRLIIIADFQ